MGNMMMNVGNNLIMNPNSFMQNNYGMFNNNMNNNMMSNMGMNFMNSNNNMFNNNFNNNVNMNNNYGNNMGMGLGMNNQFNSFNSFNSFNNYGLGFNNNINNMNNFNGMNSNLSNITMNNLFNMGMNTNMNNNMDSNMNNNMNCNMNSNNISNNKLQKLYSDIVDISDCFEYNSKIDFFTGQNQIYCNKCNLMSNANYTTNLETSPKVLILLLNRGTGLQFKIKLEFPLELNIGNYIRKNEGNTNYKLIGVITHLGESGQSGHFIAHCLSPIDNGWYTYNDAIVTKIDDIKKQVVDLGMPYLLFYQRKE